MQIEPQMVGREEELGRLRSVLNEIFNGHGKVFFISGEGGIGKTRLAFEFDAEATEKGAKVLVGNCVPSSRIGYMPFLEALSGLAEDTSGEKPSRVGRLRSSAKKAAPDLMEAVPIVGNILKGAGVFLNEYQQSGEVSEVDDKQMLFATLKLLSEETAKRPIVLQLDDLQWADTATVGLLHFLARNCRDMRLLILGIYRPEDILLDRKVGGNPFLDSLRIMRRENLCDELTLGPLTEGEVSQIVTGLLSRPVGTLTVNRIYRESGGKPLFTVEMTRQMEEGGSIEFKGGENNILELPENDLPISVKEVVLRRIERLSKEERRSLEYASVIGMTFDTEILAEALRVDHLTLLESLEHLHDDHNLVREVEGGYIFEEEQVRRVTYEGISKLRRKEVHKVIAHLLEARLPNESLYQDLARHYHFSGDSGNAVKYSLLAGRFCLERQVVIEAFPFFELAANLTAKDPSQVTAREAALEGLADCYLTRDRIRADALYEECLGLMTVEEDLARLNRKRAECWLPNALGKGDPSNAERLLGLASASNPSGSIEGGEIAVLRGQLARMRGDAEVMMASYSTAIDIFRTKGMPNRVADLLFMQTIALIQMGKTSSAGDRLEELRMINTGIDSNRTDAEVALCNGILRYLQGDIDAGLALITRAVDIAAPLGNFKLLSTIMVWRANAFMEKGAYEKALTDLEDGLQCNRTVDMTFDQAVMCFYSGICHLMRGEAKSTEDHLKDVAVLSSTYSGYLGRVLDCLLGTGKAMVFHRAGDLKASQMSFENGLRGTGKELLFFVPWEAKVREDQAILLRKMGQLDQAKEASAIAVEIYSALGNTKKGSELTRGLV